VTQYSKSRNVRFFTSSISSEERNPTPAFLTPELNPLLTNTCRYMHFTGCP